MTRLLRIFGDRIAQEISERSRPEHKALLAELRTMDGRWGGGLGFLAYVDGEIDTTLLSVDVVEEVNAAVYEAAYDAGWSTLTDEMLRFLPALNAIERFRFVGRSK